MTDHKNYKTDGAYRVDVTDDGRGWATNALRFDSVEEATAYAYDLSGRWLAVKAARVVESSTPDSEAVDREDSHIVVNYF